MAYTSSNAAVKVFDFNDIGDFEDITLDLGGRAAVGLIFSYYSASGTAIVDGQVTLEGAVSVTGAINHGPVIVTSSAGDLTVAGSVIEFPNAVTEGFGTVVIENPPAILRLTYFATTFPATNTGAAYVKCSAWWR
jgi:hypothetical protein